MTLRGDRHDPCGSLNDDWVTQRIEMGRVLNGQTPASRPETMGLTGVDADVVALPSVASLALNTAHNTYYVKRRIPIPSTLLA